jgi:type II secretory pathway predicted ATPase ExeA
LSLFIKSLDNANYQILATSLTTLGPFSFIAHLAALLGLPGKRFKGETAASLLAHFRSQPKRTLVLVDEAHLLPDSSLEDLRLLTADDLDRKSPFTLILVDSLFFGTGSPSRNTTRFGSASAPVRACGP